MRFVYILEFSSPNDSLIALDMYRSRAEIRMVTMMFNPIVIEKKDVLNWTAIPEKKSPPGAPDAMIEKMPNTRRCY